ncbi:sensor domain-containing diguanylate cyclase [Burkholderia glumae]
MLTTDTGGTQVAPAGGPPVDAECTALLHLARAHFGSATALIVVPAAGAMPPLAHVGAWPMPLPADPFAADPFAADAGRAPGGRAPAVLPREGQAWLPLPTAAAAPAQAPGCYAACALRGRHGGHLGTLLLLDAAPRTLDAAQHAFLAHLASAAGPALERLLASTAGVEAGAPIAHDLVALALKGSGTGIWDRDVAAGEIRYSAEWKAILGYEPHELSHRIEDAVERVHPDDRAYVQAEMRTHLEGGSDRYEVEHRIRCKDGSYKWICSRGKVVSRDLAGRALRMVGATTDITALREAVMRHQQTIDLITNLTDEVVGLVFQYRETADGRRFFSYASRGIEQIYELDAKDVATSAEAVDARIDARDLAAYRRSLRESAANLSPWRLEYRVWLPRQGLRWRQGEARPQRLPEGGTLWHGFITDVTERKRIETELHELATTDHLTELSNRRDFLARSEAELARLRRAGRGATAVLMLDLDHFKSLNDRWGHALGDRALRHFAQLLRQEARGKDIVGRIGGEEFAVVLPGLGIDAALAFGMRLQRRMSTSPLALDDRLVVLTVSIGVDRMIPTDPGVDQVLTRCDKALYLAKARGRNRVELYGE